MPFSIKIKENFKSTTFSSELPLSRSAKFLDFWHSGIRAMIQKRSRCLTPRVLMIFCVLLRSHLYATQLLTEEHTVLALQVCTIVYSLYTLTAARGATRYMMVGCEKNYAPFYRISGPILNHWSNQGIKLMMELLLCSSVDAQIKMLCFYNFALF